MTIIGPQDVQTRIEGEKGRTPLLTFTIEVKPPKKAYRDADGRIRYKDSF